MRLTERQIIHDSDTKLNAIVKIHYCVKSIYAFSEGEKNPFITQQRSKNVHVPWH